MIQEEVVSAYRFLNRLNCINIIENSEILPLEKRKFVWYKLYSRKRKRIIMLN